MLKKYLKKINLEKDKKIDLKFFRNSNKKELNIKYDKNILINLNYFIKIFLVLIKPYSPHIV